MWEEATVKDPGDDPALQSFHDEGVRSLGTFGLLRRVMASATAPLTSAGPLDPDDKPVLPTQSQEDTDAGWGEQAEPDDEHLYRERPPHWDSA